MGRYGDEYTDGGSCVRSWFGKRQTMNGDAGGAVRASPWGTFLEKGVLGSGSGARADPVHQVAGQGALEGDAWGVLPEAAGHSVL